MGEVKKCVRQTIEAEADREALKPDASKLFNVQQFGKTGVGGYGLPPSPKSCQILIITIPLSLIGSSKTFITSPTARSQIYIGIAAISERDPSVSQCSLLTSGTTLVQRSSC